MLKVLLKTRLQALLSRFSAQNVTKSKRALNTGTVLAMALLMCGIAGGIIYGVSVLLAPFCELFMASDMEWLYYAMGALLVLMISFLLTMFYAQGAIFVARDNEMLLSMPIPPSAILGSRILSLLVLNLTMDLVLLLGVGLARLKAGPIPAEGIVLFLLSALLLPFLSSALSCLLGWLVSLITRRMRMKNLFQMVFSIALMVLFYLVSQNLNTYVQQIMQSSGDIAAAIRRVLPPFYFMGSAVAGGNWLHFLIYAAFCLVPFALVYLILSASFIRIVTVRPATVKMGYDGSEVRSSSVTMALAKKDLRRFISSPSYMLNAGLGIPLSVAVGLVALIGGVKSILGILGVVSDSEDVSAMLPLVGCFILGMAVSMNYLSAPSISVENKSLWIMRSMPITARQAIGSKLLFHLIPGIPSALVGSVLFCLACRPEDFAQGLCLVLIPPLLTLFSAAFGLFINLRMHRFDYQSEAAAVRNSASSVITCLVVIVLAFFPFIGFLASDVLGLDLTGILLMQAALVLALDIVLLLLLFGKGSERKWNSL